MLVLLVGLMTGCSREREEKYYADKSNFITGEAIVENIIYDEEDNEIILWLHEIDEAYQTGNFKIKGENTQLVLERGILEKLKIGDVITFTSAPRFFYDGYFMPVVAITVSGEDLLDFEEGHKNLMQLY